MRIIVIGGTGLIGKAVIDRLKPRHEVIVVGHNSESIRVDITDTNSIANMYREIGKFDAMVATTGRVAFAEFAALTEKNFHDSLADKLMGQINLVRLGMSYINNNGSFTLTSGILNHDPIRTGVAAATVNAALEGFVKAAAIELTDGLRINLVSPTVIQEALPKYENYFRGYHAVSVAEVALAYEKSVEGKQTGQIYKVGY